MSNRQIRVRLGNHLYYQFRDLLPGHGQMSKAIRRFIRIFVEEAKREPNPEAKIDYAALQTATEILEETRDGRRKSESGGRGVSNSDGEAS